MSIQQITLTNARNSDQWGTKKNQNLKDLFFWGLSNLPKVSIVYRIAATFTVLIVVGMGVLGAIILRYQTGLMQEQVNYHGQSLVNQLANSAVEPLFTDDYFNLQVLVNQLVTDPLIRGVSLYDETNKVLFTSGDVPIGGIQRFLVDEDTYLTSNRAVYWTSAIVEEELDMVSFVAPIEFKGVVAGHALVTLTTESVHSGFQKTIRVLIASTILMTLLAVVLAYWMSRRLASPVKALVSVTEGLSSGDYSTRIHWERQDELGQLAEALNKMSQSLHEKRQMEGVLSRFVADDVAKSMLNDLDKVNIGCERVDASVLFVDIVGYTELAEKSSTEDVVEILNEYLAYFTLCSQLFFGTVDKFIGDCAMVIFGAPKLNNDHRFNAIACAQVMLRLLNRINELRRQKGQQEIEVRIGINSGDMMAGYVGAQQRMEYTVVGDTVNVASRLSRMAEPGQIIVGEDVVTDPSLKGRINFSLHQNVTVKGRKGATKTFLIDSIQEQYQQAMDVMIEDVLRQMKPNPDAKSDLKDDEVQNKGLLK